MRLSFITGVLDLGGSTTFLLNLTSELQSRGIPNLVLSFEENHPLAADFAANKIRVIRQHNSRGVFEDRMTNVLSELRSFSPTHVIACLSPESFEVLRYVPSEVPRFGMVQSDDPAVYRTLSAYASYMNATIGVSQKSISTLQSHATLGLIPSHYLPYGIPILPGRFRPLNRQAPLRIIYLGRLDQEQKRVRLLPLIQRQLVQMGIPFSWTIAGEGPERDFLETEMKGSELCQITFTGTVSYGDVPRLLEQHDVLILASNYEGLPLSLLEAMAAGVVPVVSDLTSGIREVVDETNGILVDPDNVDGFAAGIDELDKDRLALNEKSRNARSRVVEKFSTAAMTDRWLKLLGSYPSLGATWQTKFKVLAPVTAPYPILFTTPGRLLRRMSKRFSSLIN